MARQKVASVVTLTPFPRSVYGLPFVQVTARVEERQDPIRQAAGRRRRPSGMADKPTRGCLHLTLIH
jgi:hypothetical protein